MKSQIPPAIADLVSDFDLEVHGSPFHAAEGLELWKHGRDPDMLVCVGYILGPENTAIYRRTDSKRDLFRRNRLWFLPGWLIKRRPTDNQYRVLRRVRSAEFTDELFVAIAKNEFEKEERRSLARHP